MKLNIILLPLLAILFVSAAKADEPIVQNAFRTGNILLAECNGNPVDVHICHGYLMGVNDAVDAMRIQHGQKPCVPPDVEASQLEEIVVAYLRAHPTVRQNPAALLVTKAIWEAWGCK